MSLLEQLSIGDRRKSHSRKCEQPPKLFSEEIFGGHVC